MYTPLPGAANRHQGRPCLGGFYWISSAVQRTKRIKAAPRPRSPRDPREARRCGAGAYPGRHAGSKRWLTVGMPGRLPPSCNATATAVVYGSPWVHSRFRGAMAAAQQLSDRRDGSKMPWEGAPSCRPGHFCGGALLRSLGLVIHGHNRRQQHSSDASLTWRLTQRSLRKTLQPDYLQATILLCGYIYNGAWVRDSWDMWSILNAIPSRLERNDANDLPDRREILVLLRNYPDFKSMPACPFSSPIGHAGQPGPPLFRGYGGPGQPNFCTRLCVRERGQRTPSHATC